MKKLVLVGLMMGGGSASAQDQPQPVCTHVEQMPELLEGGGEPAIREALQQGVVLPFGTPVPTAK